MPIFNILSQECAYFRVSALLQVVRNWLHTPPPPPWCRDAEVSGQWLLVYLYDICHHNTYPPPLPPTNPTLNNGWVAEHTSGWSLEFCCFSSTVEMLDTYSIRAAWQEAFTSALSYIYTGIHIIWYSTGKVRRGARALPPLPCLLPQGESKHYLGNT